MFKPAKGKALIEKRAFELKSRGGIIYPGTGLEAQKRRVFGTVLAVGDGCKNVEKGDHVMFDGMAGLDLVGSDHFDIADDGFPVCYAGKPSDAKTYCVIDEEEIFAVIDEEEFRRVN